MSKTTTATKATDTSRDNERRILYDRKGAAHQLSISVRAIDYLIQQQRIATRRIGGRVLVHCMRQTKPTVDDGAREMRGVLRAVFFAPRPQA